MNFFMMTFALYLILMAIGIVYGLARRSGYDQGYKCGRQTSDMLADMLAAKSKVYCDRLAADYFEFREKHAGLYMTFKDYILFRKDPESFAERNLGKL